MAGRREAECILGIPWCETGLVKVALHGMDIRNTCLLSRLDIRSTLLHRQPGRVSTRTTYRVVPLLYPVQVKPGTSIVYVCTCTLYVLYCTGMYVLHGQRTGINRILHKKWVMHG